MNEDWVLPVLSYMGSGLIVTFEIALLSAFFATALGLAIGMLSLSRRRWVRRCLGLYVDFFRGIPSLLVLLFVFFALPQLIGVATDPITSSVLGLALWASANVAETARGALQAIPPAQAEAGAALGMNRYKTLVFIIVPEAVRRFLPPYIGQITILIQATALTSIVGVNDLQGTAQQMTQRLAYTLGDSHAILIYGLVLLAFFAICYPLTIITDRLERNLKV
jgi:polar amino acid transport system permease protein